MPLPKGRGRANGTSHVSLRPRDRVFQRVPEGELRGHGGGKGATGAVRASSGQPTGAEIYELTSVVQPVGDNR